MCIHLAIIRVNYINIEMMSTPSFHSHTLIITLNS